MIDGKVNPDVRTLPDPQSFNDVSQAIFFNATAHPLTGYKIYADNVVKLLEDFFLNPDSKMNPHMNFGQVVRGPGPKHSIGTFTGTLDTRGLVKIVNALLLIKQTGYQGWDANRERGMRQWVQAYIRWLSSSELAKKAQNSPK